MNSAIPERRPATEEISGVIERVTFHNDENSFCVQQGYAVHAIQKVYGLAVQISDFLCYP
jgi:hypothetical protein